MLEYSGFFFKKNLAACSCQSTTQTPSLGWFTAAQRRDMLELLDDRYGNRSTLVTSRMPLDKWHALIGDPTLGDAILDWLAQNAYRIELEGESMRRSATKLTMATTSD